MWIKMLRDQVRAWGIFLKGQTHSLPVLDVEKLDKDSYIQVEVDERAIERMGVEERVRHFRAELATLGSAIGSTEARLADLKIRRKTMQDKLAAAEKALKEIAAEPKETSPPGEPAGEPPGEPAGEPPEGAEGKDKDESADAKSGTAGKSAGKKTKGG